MSLVLDVSVTLAYLMSEESTDSIVRVWDQVMARDGWVPGLWWIETANALISAERAGRIDLAFRKAALGDLITFPINTDVETWERAWQQTALSLAERHRLTAYDAAYLELALRRGLPLATLDSELRVAATAERVPLLGI